MIAKRDPPCRRGPTAPWQRGGCPGKHGGAPVSGEVGPAVRDTIRLDAGTGDFEDALARREFTIVGTADSPLYISVERGSSSLGTEPGAVSAFVLLPQAASLDYYTDAYLRAEGAEELAC